MSSYDALAASYDGLMADGVYRRRADYLEKLFRKSAIPVKTVLGRITLFGAIYLGIVAICPLIVGKVINNGSLAIGGTSVIIVVGVALETVKALENQMLMRQYKGFLE